MARETLYMVQSFRSGKGTRLIADSPIRCKTSENARIVGEKLATARTGVVAFSTSGDPEIGEYDEVPDIIFKAGRLPAPFEEA